MAKAPYQIRPSRPTDHPFIYASWLNSFEPFRDKRIARDLYYQEHHEAIGRLLTHASSEIFVAAAADDENLLFGFVLGGVLPVGDVLDYVFVKPIYRRMGIGRALVTAFSTNCDAYTHHTEFSRYVVGRAAFDPYRFHCRA